MPRFFRGILDSSASVFKIRSMLSWVFTEQVFKLSILIRPFSNLAGKYSRDLFILIRFVSVFRKILTKSEKMDGAPAAGYWCHVCARIVNPVMEADIKCPRCDGGFIEEMEGQAESNSTAAASADLDSDRDIPVWAPILLGMLGDGLRRRSSRSSRSLRGGGDSDDSSEQESETQGRQSAILEVINDLQEREMDRRRERVIVINPFSQAVIIRGAGGEGQGLDGADLGDYFIGPGLEQLLQHLAEGDPSRRGTPPAKKEAVEAMPTVRVVERAASCYVCLEELEIGEEAREMPCKHRFHGGCILPWLEAHSTCPVCRHQLPVEGPKEDATVGDGGSGENVGNGRRFRMPVPWPFSGLFSSSGASQNNANGHGDGNGSSNSRSDES